MYCSKIRKALYAGLLSTPSSPRLRNSRFHSAKCYCTRNPFLKILVISSRSNRTMSLYNIPMENYRLYFLIMVAFPTWCKTTEFSQESPLPNQVPHQPALYKDKHYSPTLSQALLQKDQRNLTPLVLY